MRSYTSYIAGSDMPAEQWVYTIKASALLEDFLGKLKLKRSLEKGIIGHAVSYPEVLARSAIASQDQLNLALEAAHDAGPKWADFPLERRLLLARRFHFKVLKHREELIEILMAEGHPRRLAEWEVAGILQCSSEASLALWRQQLYQERVIGKRRLLLVRKPDGVVCLSPPQNAAASNSVGGLSVLVAGNSLVVKAPRSCPLGVMYIWRDLIAPILEELGAPSGTLNIICGNPNTIMNLWLDSPLVNDIFFFGGSKRGIEIGNEAVAKGKKPVLELAGNDGCLIWSDADLDRAAQALTECFFGSGQICMVPKYAIVHPSVADALLEKLCERIKEIRPGMPEAANALLSPVLRTDAYFEHLNAALNSGAQLVTGGYRVELSGESSETGPFISPTVLRIDGLENAKQISAVTEETFFPLLPIVVPEFENEHLLDAVIHFMNANRYGLRNSFWTSDPELIETITRRVTNGGLLKINDSHIGFTPWLATHGGTGLTGGPFGELNYPLLRTSHLQGISIGEDIDPAKAVFESQSVPDAAHEPIRSFGLEVAS